MMRLTEEQKMILNCYEGGKTKVIYELQKSMEESFREDAVGSYRICKFFNG